MAKKPTTAHSAHDDHGHGAPAGAGDGVITSGMDYAAHEAMYHRFTDLVKWGIVAVAVLVVFLFIDIRPFVS